MGINGSAKPQKAESKNCKIYVSTEESKVLHVYSSLEDVSYNKVKNCKRNEKQYNTDTKK